MSDVKEHSENKTSHVMMSSCEEFREGTNSAPVVTSKKIFKPKFPYLWIFGKSNEDERIGGDGVQLNFSNLPRQSCNEQVLKNGNFEDTSTSDLKHMMDDSRNCDGSPPLYYGVSLPSCCSNVEDGDDPLVFTDKKEALRVVKKYKGARFKAFAKEEQAVIFASQPADEICPTPTSQSSFSLPISGATSAQGLMVEKPSPFRGPKSQEMVKLRKAIESGDETFFMETVWSNPRYLISSCDTPAIMQEGFRYNGLHVAAKHKQPRMCQLILETVQNPKFMGLLYSEDTEESRSPRINYVLDLYLNTPDKGLCETPLHFASKFGCFEAVELLAFHPLCDKWRKNKYGLEAREIICERCPSTSPELKKKIEKIFEEQYFVPVLRAEDNSLPPVIGEPYSPENPKVPYSCGPVTPVCPLDPPLSIVAVAGPMSTKDATDFYQLWRTPPSTMLIAQETSRPSRIRLSDTEKGLERIGRYLAQSVKTSWTEYWPLLDTWADLSTDIGLQKLEKHLSLNYSCSQSDLSSNSSEDKKTRDSDNSRNRPDVDLGARPVLSKTSNTSSLNSTSSSSSGISQLCHRLEDFHLSDSEDSLLKTSPDMPRVLKSHCDPFHLSESPLNSPHAASPVNPTFDVILTNEVTCSKLSKLTESNMSVRNKNVLHKNELKFSTPKTDVINDCTLIVVKNVIQSLLEVFSELLTNSEANIMSQTTFHKYLVDDVLPHVKYLHEATYLSDSERETAHCDIALKVYKEIQDSFMYHEIRLIVRHLATYLESKFSNASSDDEPVDNRKCLFVKPRCLTISNSVTWKQLMCVLIFLYGFLSNNEHVSNISITVCQCNWESKEDLLKMKNREASEQNSSSSDDSSDEEYITPPSSPENSSGSSTPEELSTPDEGMEIYVKGSFPSKADADILRVVENVNIDPLRFPHICRWKHLMSSYDKEVIESWPSPSQSGYRQPVVYSKSRTPYRPRPVFSSGEVREPLTPLHNRPRGHPLHQRTINSRSLCEKFLALEQME